jgi:hypothetical protein
VAWGGVNVWRAVAAGVAVIVAAASGVVTGLVTTRPSRGLWVALGVAVLMGALLQAALTFGEGRKVRRAVASGAGAVAVGGSARGEIRTRVRGRHVPPSVTDDHDGLIASGPGAVAIGGDAARPVSTDVTSSDAKERNEET